MSIDVARSKKNTRTRHKRRKQSKYRSKFESDFAKHLQDRKLDFDYESEKIEYVTYHCYTPDFVFDKKDGAKMYVETKGVLDARSRTVLKNAKKCNPELDIRLIFQRGSNTISKKSSTTYLEWAKKNGFPCAETKMPSEWKKELLSE
ncbi:MAG: hypothetical protein ACO39G_08615 [Flavobacteriaceae bacterium]